MEVSRAAKMVRSIRRWRKTSSDGRPTSKSRSGVPPDVPEGHLAVYAGSGLEIRRFIVPATYFNHPLFRALLDKAEEEFGFTRSGPILIPCNPILFHRTVLLIRKIAENATDYTIDQPIAHEKGTVTVTE